MSHSCAVVLLSAYGDSPHLAAQVRSVVRQMEPEDLLVVVDDGSRQVPWGQIAPLLPPRYLCWSRMHNLGSSQSFLELLFLPLESRATHFFLADQDDVWLPGKLACQRQSTRPDSLSVHAVEVGWSSAIQPGAEVRSAIPRRSPAHYFFETPAPGMTFCIGAELRGMLLREQAVLLAAARALPHDRILAGCAGWMDKVQRFEAPLVHYRQHAGNQIGFRPLGLRHRWMHRVRRLRQIWQQMEAACVLLSHWAAAHPSSDAMPRPWHRQRLRDSRVESRLFQCLLRLRFRLRRGGSLDAH